MKLSHSLDVHSGMLSDPGDQGPVWQGVASINESNRHHHGGDQGIEVDGGLSQECVEDNGLAQW
jgi:hypothetical protein